MRQNGDSGKRGILTDVCAAGQRSSVSNPRRPCQQRVTPRSSNCSNRSERATTQAQSNDTLAIGIGTPLALPQINSRTNQPLAILPPSPLNRSAPQPCHRLASNLTAYWLSGYPLPVDIVRRSSRFTFGAADCVWHLFNVRPRK